MKRNLYDKCKSLSISFIKNFTKSFLSELFNKFFNLFLKVVSSNIIKSLFNNLKYFEATSILIWL